MSDPKQITPGDTVQLKSGNSPVMVVDSVGVEGFRCLWAWGSDVHSEHINSNSLVLVPNPRDIKTQSPKELRRTIATCKMKIRECEVEMDRRKELACD